MKEYDFLDLVKKQKEFYFSDATKQVDFRLVQLKKLYKVLVKREEDIFKALSADFGKSDFETYGTEISLVKKEIRYLIQKLPTLARKKRVKTTRMSFPSANYIYTEPYGVALVIGAWNYPLLLTLLPAVGAMAAGNCVIVKPSEISINTSHLIKQIVKEIFEDRYFEVVEGGPEETQALLREPLDYVFFTGSSHVGKIILQAAAQQLIPVTLELGGKSPCIVDKDANIKHAARRIIWGKCVNAGQTCVAPDYLYAHEDIREELINKMVETLKKFYGNNPMESPDLPRIINQHHFNRLLGLLKDTKVIIGGQALPDKNKIAPTLLVDVSWDDPVMKEEIFGPILPILSFNKLDDVMAVIQSQPKPLALYYFSTSRKKQRKILKGINFGGGCINDCLFQFGNSNLPLGGTGNSGMGQYHGVDSFYTFSHKKSIVDKPNWLDIPLRYPPYRGKLKWIKRILEL